MKTKIAIILSSLSFLGVLIIVGIWIFQGYELSVVSIDTFIGVIVASLAILFTLLIGVRIIDELERREKIIKLEEKQDALLEIERAIVDNQQNFSKLANNLQSGLSSTNADYYILKGLYAEAFGCCHSALHHAILAGSSGLLNRVFQLQWLIIVISSKPAIDLSVYFNQIVFESNEIRKSEPYRSCLSESYEKTMRDFWERMGFLGLSIPEKR